MQQFFSLLSWRLFTVQHVLGVFPPIIRGSVTAVAASGFPFVSWWQSCCCLWSGRPAGRTPRPRAHSFPKNGIFNTLNPSIAVVFPWQLPRSGSDKRVTLYKDTCYARFISGEACVYLNVCNTNTIHSKMIIISTTRFNIPVFCFIATQVN
jgi:hypothetical protein